MQKKRQQHVLTLLIAATLLALAGTVTPVRSQDLVCCGMWIDADGPWIGAWRDCKAALEQLSPASRANACQQIRKSRVPIFRPFAPFSYSYSYSAIRLDCCPEVAELCGHVSPNCKQDPPTVKCEPPPPETNNPPWLNKDSACQDWQRGTLSWSQTPASKMDVSFTVSMCGEVIRYTNRGGGSPERMPPGSRSFDVCCDSWRNAADTGSPCDARRDIDCDGELNESDQMPDESFRERRSDDYVSNSPLGGLPFWKKLHAMMPGASGCKDCKWELVRVEYTCKNVADPVRAARQNREGMVFDATYKYQATWKCPATGATQQTQDVVPMVDLRCPTPPNRSWP